MTHPRGGHRLPSYLLLALLLAPHLLLAHALLLRSTPAPHANVSGTALAIELHFNSRVDGARSRLTLTQAGDTTAAHPFLLAKLAQSAPEILTSAPAAALPHGSYVLHWIVLASDGHISRGEIPFAVQ